MNPKLHLEHAVPGNRVVFHLQPIWIEVVDWYASMVSRQHFHFGDPRAPVRPRVGLQSTPIGSEIDPKFQKLLQFDWEEKWNGGLLRIPNHFQPKNSVQPRDSDWELDGPHPFCSTTDTIASWAFRTS